ncbi:hypothetical protein PTSG_05403 [Salpingoeca rosetta]|uniref:EamA domain-containing protein n=1 Tax=Salpingoeca rosetta (strain ATCC 50818 / BSB-021) TaxID=946362 RepID=F2UAC0_SALR5|nr:uncharacterized protein PTSG_05403 [Salpingoeca rosetta]EGD73695.1 hypothetical protein PTSG_05403 [Salpingoeca rosetta]|eukprot:XP_004993976.1 hypothetical protein PTSG_05403 [Salpingoeca rosetta]
MAMGSMPVQLQGLNEEDGNAVAVVWMVRTVTAAVFMMANARMWVAFSAALAASESAFVPTIVNFVINSITSTLLGFVVFGDAIVWQVALGNACMISGAVLLLSA